MISDDGRRKRGCCCFLVTRTVRQPAAQLAHSNLKSAAFTCPLPHSLPPRHPHRRDRAIH